MAPVIPPPATSAITRRCRTLVLDKSATWSGRCLQWMKSSRMWTNLEKNFKLELIQNGNNEVAVHKAEHLGSGEQVAVKCFSKQVLKEKDHLKHKVRNELEIHRTLDHSNIISAYVSFENRQSVGLVMELGPKDLYEHSTSNPPQEASTREVVYDVLSALQYMHNQGIVHRDVKPENVFASKDGRWKLGDFGSAVRLSDMSTVAAEGTVGYMAPEYLAIWSVPSTTTIQAATTSKEGDTDELITEKTLSKDTIKVPSYTMSRKASNFIKSALQKDPSKRPTVAELLEHEWMQPPPRSAAAGVTEGTKLAQRTRKPRVTRAAAAAAAAAAVAPSPAS